MKNKNIFLVKFTVVAVMVGLFSPSIQIEQKENQTKLNISVLQKADARGNHRKANRGGNRNKNRNVNRNSNSNKNTNVNVNVNSNRYYGGHRRYGYYRGRPLVGFTTGLVLGTMIAASTMPTTCTTVIVNGISYRRCSNAYYQPFYEGDVLVYKVVASPY